MSARVLYAVALLVIAPLLGAADDDSAPPAFAVVSRAPVLELHFSGMTLTQANEDSSLNEIALKLSAPADASLFDQLTTAAPDWIASAYAGQDVVVIRAIKPVQFLTRAEGDGFSLRLTPREDAPDEPRPLALRGDVDGGQSAPINLADTTAVEPCCDKNGGGGHGGALHTGIATTHLGDWQFADRTHATATAMIPEHPALRGELDLADRRGTNFGLGGEWRHSHEGTLVSADAQAGVAIGPNWMVLASADGAWADGAHIRRLDGSKAALDTKIGSGALGVAYLHDGGGMTAAQVLYGRGGVGGRLSFAESDATSELGASATYHAPYLESLEAIAQHGVRDRVDMYAAGEIADGLWLMGAINANRYGVAGDSDVARTAGFAASVRYVADVFGWPLGLSYDVDGEYVLASQKYPIVSAPTTFFQPLSIRTREVHSLTGSYSFPLARDFWFDMYGGYGADRYGTGGAWHDRGVLGGAAFRFVPAPGLALSLGGAYSQVGDREGETGPVASAGLTLSYALPSGS